MTPRPPVRHRPKFQVEMLTTDAGEDQPKFLALLDDYALEGMLQTDTDQGVMRLVYLSISAISGGVDISTTTLRQMPIAEIVQEGKRAAAAQVLYSSRAERAELYARNGWGEPPEDVPEHLIRTLRTRVKAASREGSAKGAARGRGDAFYRRVALDLIEIVESGKIEPGGALETLARVEARRLKQREVPIQTVRTWLRVARARQFLAPAERGRLSAVAGPRLYGDES